MKKKRNESILPKFKKIIFNAYLKRSRFPITNFPIPIFLPFRKLFLSFGDLTGFKLLRTSLTSDDYEDGIWKILIKLIKPNSTVVDVGANQGFYTLLFSKLAGKRGKVFAFEPNPSIIKKLKANLFINFVTNVKTECIALADKEGLAEFYQFFDGMSSYSSLAHHPHLRRFRFKKIEIETTTLDSYFQKRKIKDISLIKIDAEGADFKILKGGVKLIKKFRPIFMIEFADKASRQFNYQSSDMYSWLEKKNYIFYENNKGRELIRAKPQKKYIRCWKNLLAFPKEKKVSF